MKADSTQGYFCELACGEVATAAQAVVVAGGATVVDEACGSAIQPDSRFLLFSVSKVITAIAVLRLVDAGEITLSTAVASVVPGFEAAGKENVTVEDVLTHRGGFPEVGLNGDVYVGLEDFVDWDHAVELMCAIPLEPSLAGSVYYHGISFSILGAVVERVAGVTFPAFCQNSVFEPIGMRHTTWGLPASARPLGVELDGPDRVPWTGSALWDAYVPAANAWSTAGDIAMTLQMLARGGVAAGGKVLSADLVQEMTSPHGNVGDEVGVGYGLLLNQPSRPVFGRGHLGSSNCFGHSGSQQCQAWHDVDYDLTMIALTNSATTQEASDRRFDLLSDGVYRRFGRSGGFERANGGAAVGGSPG